VPYYPPPSQAGLAGLDTRVDALESHTPGQELAYAERTSAFTTTNTTAGAAAGLVAGLSVTVTGAGRAVDVVFFVPLCYHSVGGTGIVAYVVQGQAYPGGLCAIGAVSSPNNTGRSVTSTRRLVLSAGVQYTFEAGMNGVAAGTVTSVPNAAYPMSLSVTSR